LTGVARASPKCYIVTNLEAAVAHTHDHSHPHHHHHPGEAHPLAAVSPSILRLSAVERLAAASVAIAAIWAAVLWAIS
jgi:hypothetical protein